MSICIKILTSFILKINIAQLIEKFEMLMFLRFLRLAQSRKNRPMQNADRLTKVQEIVIFAKLNKRKLIYSKIRKHQNARNILLLQ